MRRRICRLELLKLGAKLRLQRGRGRGRRWRRFGILCGGPGKGGGCGLVFLFFFGGFFGRRRRRRAEEREGRGGITIGQLEGISGKPQQG